MVSAVGRCAVVCQQREQQGAENTTLRSPRAQGQGARGVVPYPYCLWSLHQEVQQPVAEGGKILVFPVDGSHWVNMEVLLKQLHARGHQITVFRPTQSWFIKEIAPHYTSISVQVPRHEQVGLDLFEKSAQRILEGRLQGSLMGSVTQVRELMSVLQLAHKATCTVASIILQDRDLVNRLKAAEYDLMLTDPAMPAGVLLGHYLRLPMVYNVRWMSFGEGHFSIAPSPISYVPVPGSGLSDHMGLLHRSRNLFHYLLNSIQERWLVVPTYEALIQRYFPPGTDLLSLQLMADVWLVRADFVFEFPRPTMPNLVYMGGFQCRPAKPLPHDLEDFVQGSGPHGVILMSLGTLISALPMEVTEVLASAFSQLPQRVIWRYDGRRPRTLGNNTLLVKWLPQNDLLGHAKTRAFVAHGGTNGLYEAIYHGVPVLGVPLLFDQMDNLVRLEARGAAKVLDLATLTTAGFLDALEDILYNPTYRDNMQRLSSLHRDRPIHPLDKAVFWVEYVMRNKGAPHLRTEASGLPWWSYYALDVLGVLLAAPLVLLGCLALLVRTLRKFLPGQDDTKYYNYRRRYSKEIVRAKLQSIRRERERTKSRKKVPVE
ncbi:UDP-glucuronosyltransferase 2C1-like [Engraulis encrasicolus]|uniref:UDP-glucuronosyltransferase 2C1-like n=1 Tax=Engraulis encrasicolus TaxID=184585 RepID=UPI002FCFE87E